MLSDRLKRYSKQHDNSPFLITLKFEHEHDILVEQDNNTTDKETHLKNLFICNSCV